jgi:hypothetical protein
MLALVAAMPVMAVPISGSEVLGVSLAVVVNAEIECSAQVTLTDGSQYTFEGLGKVVVAENSDENILFQCRGVLLDEPPAHAIRANSDRSYPFVCFDGTSLVDALDWQVQITPSGQGMYNCHVNPAVEVPF